MAKEKTKVLFLTKYGRLGASSRMRTWQYIPRLEEMGIEAVVDPLINDELLAHQYSKGKRTAFRRILAYGNRVRRLANTGNFDVVWIEKEALPYLPWSIESLMFPNKPVVIDIDDAIFHNYDLHRSTWVRTLLGDKIDRAMASAKIVLAGNSYLADRALNAGATDVRVIPTSIDMRRYEPHLRDLESKPLSDLVWIGSPSTAKYLDEIRVPLARVAASRSISLTVIGAQIAPIPGCTINSIPWSEETEVASIRLGRVGIMPLLDGPWERGKCAYKLIQYMGCELPVIASDVGANRDVIEHGKVGFLATTDEDWIEGLGNLICNGELQSDFSIAGNARARQRYSMDVQLPQIFAAIADAARS